MSPASQSIAVSQRFDFNANGVGDSSQFAHGHRSESLKLGYCAPNRQPDTGCHLVQFHHVVCEEYTHRSIVWVGLPPSAVCTRPAYRVSVPGHALRRGPETSVTSPLRWRCFKLIVTTSNISRRRGRGTVVIPKGFPKRVGRVGSRLYGFPCFPLSVDSMACFSLIIECIGDFASHGDRHRKICCPQPLANSLDS
jgi:hypothetical protein